MQCRFTIRSGLPRTAVEGRLAALTVGGPFRVQELLPGGGGGWTFVLLPRRPGLAVGFGKVAELLVLLARDFEVERMERLPASTLAVAS